MPGPAQHERLIETDVKMVLAPRIVIARRPEADVAILRRQRQLVWGIVESNGFKFRRRVKNGKIF